VLPAGDRTPADYGIPSIGIRERLKRPLRAVIYPPYNAIMSRWLASRYAQPDFNPDLWLWGQRGNDYARHRRRVDRYLTLRGADIVVAGCGTGRDIDSWVAMQPRRIFAVDWFNYDRAWQAWRDHYRATASQVHVAFAQADLEDLSGVPGEHFDVFASDAVFEHLRDLGRVLIEAHRILRAGGVLYATFGPLWYAWGGDHVSGFDGLGSGYNHLLLELPSYQKYLAALGPSDLSEHDGRVWIDNDLFSRLRPSEYLARLAQAGFERLFVAAILDPRAVKFLAEFPDLSHRLLQSHHALDLVTTGMTVIFRKP
jgi:SAM-dependent methyltransferase